MIKNQFGVNIKRIRFGNAKDYFNLVLNSFCQKERIIHESSCVNTPQQNGIAERKNGHLLDQTRALLFQNNVPKKFWGEAIFIATYLINRLPSKILESKSPMEVLSSFYSHVALTNKLQPRIFGCVSFVHVHRNERGKLDPRAVKCIFLGYSTTQKGYRCFHPPSKKFFMSRDVTFNKQKSHFKQPHLQGENVRKEDKPLMLLNMSFGPEIKGNGVVESENGGQEIGTDSAIVPEIEKGMEQALELITMGPIPELAPNSRKFEKNRTYSRREKAIPGFVHV